MQVFKKSLFAKVLVSIIIANFMVGSGPIAQVFATDSLRPPATSKTSIKDNIRDDFQNDGGGRSRGKIFVLSNIISLLTGPRTGGYNIENAISDGANGGIFNHSEYRRRLENRMKNMLMAIIGQIGGKIPKGGLGLHEEEAILKIWSQALMDEGLDPSEIPDTYYTLPGLPFADREAVLNKWGGALGDESDLTHEEIIAGYYSETIFSEFIERLKLDKLLESKIAELTARRLVNRIINAQLIAVDRYSNKDTFNQTILCVGETHLQRIGGKTKEVLEQDLREILQGITKQQAEQMGLRIAYEPRWAIGTGEVPTLKQINQTHKFIKETSKELLGTELDVDYGGSLKKQNCKEILALEYVDGGLIGGAAKSPEEIAPIIDEAIKQGELKGKVLNIGMNWKAETEGTFLRPIEQFLALFMGRVRDLDKVQIAIGTPRVGAVKTAIQDLENFMSADEAIYNELAGESFVKYIVKVADMGSVENVRALIIAPGFLKIGGARRALADFTKINSHTRIRVALYGENAERMKLLLGDEYVITGGDLASVLEKLSYLRLEDTLLLRTHQDRLDREIKIRQVVAGEISTMALAKAIRELFVEDEKVDDDFADFLSGVEYSGIISPETFSEVYKDVIRKLTEEEIFEFPEGLKPTEEVIKAIEEEVKIYKEFITRV